MAATGPVSPATPHVGFSPNSAAANPFTPQRLTSPAATGRGAFQVASHKSETMKKRFSEMSSVPLQKTDVQSAQLTWAAVRKLRHLTLADFGSEPVNEVLLPQEAADTLISQDC